MTSTTRDDDPRVVAGESVSAGPVAPQLPIPVVVGHESSSARRWVRRVFAEDSRLLVVGEAESAPAAVAVALSAAPRICLLSPQMPGSGIAATREIASRLPTTVVVMLADSLDPREFFAALRAGATSYVLRDMDARRLVPALLDTLRGRPAIPRSLVALLVNEFRDRGPRRRVLVPQSPGAGLTSREWQVLDLVGRGLDTGEIAARLRVSRATVRSHRAAAHRKVGLSDL